MRIADEDDAPALAHLRYLWRTRERGESGLDEVRFSAALKDWMHKHSETHIPFLGVGVEGPVAMGWLAIVDRIPGPEVFVRRSGYVQSVYVIESRRSQGIGHVLMTSIIEHARALRLDYLAVHPSERAFSLYRRLGFSESPRVLELRE